MTIDEGLSLLMLFTSKDTCAKVREVTVICHIIVFILVPHREYY